MMKFMVTTIDADGTVSVQYVSDRLDALELVSSALDDPDIISVEVEKVDG